MISICPFKIPARINYLTGEKVRAHNKRCNVGKGAWCFNCKHFAKSKVALESYLKHRRMMKKTGKNLPQLWKSNQAGIKRHFDLDDLLNFRRF